jgi:hypothetical protein
MHSGEYTISEVGDLFGVARSTVYRALAHSSQRATIASAKSPARRTPRARAEPPAANEADAAPGYRARHGASEFPPITRTARRRTPRQPCPERAAQTGR